MPTEVRIYYQGYHPALDSAIRFHLDRLGAVEISSGYGFGRRDFDLLIDAERFQALRFLLESFGLNWEVLENAENKAGGGGSAAARLENIPGD